MTAEMRTVAALLLLLDSALASWDTDNATMAQAEYEGDKIEMLSLDTSQLLSCHKMLEHPYHHKSREP